MILIKKDTTYVIKSEQNQYSLEGQVYFEGGQMIVSAQCFINDTDYIGVCSYKYKSGGNCSKTIGDCKHEYITTIEYMLEQIINFLIQRFKLS